MSSDEDDLELETGGEEFFRVGMWWVMWLLGHFTGAVTFVSTAALIAFDVVLNPIFLFAQAKSSGYEIGSLLTPFDRGFFGFLGWASVIVITICTTGLQYALLRPGTDKKSLGWISGVVIALADTLMDGGGFEAWTKGGSLLNFAGDSSHLQWGLFPPAGSTFYEDWLPYLAVCAICFAHEPLLRIILASAKGYTSKKTDILNVNMTKWVKAAGVLLNVISLLMLGLTPYFMFLLDVLLFPQAERDANSVTFVVWLILTFLTAGLGLAAWRFWSHLTTDVGLKFKEVRRKYQLIFLGAISISVFDSSQDLRGLNNVVYHQAVLVPQNLPPGGFEQWLLTGVIVMIICSAFAPMCSQLFAPYGEELEDGELTDAEILQIADEEAGGMEAERFNPGGGSDSPPYPYSSSPDPRDPYGMEEDPQDEKPPNTMG